MEYGFWHPDMGYIQMISAPNQDMMASLPHGTINVPLKPSAHHHWINGEWVYQAPALSTETFQFIVSDHIEETARQKGYDSSVSCVSYRNSAHPIWSNEAEIFFHWRDSVWIATFDMFAKVQSGEMEVPNPDTFTTLLPVIDW